MLLTGLLLALSPTLRTEAQSKQDKAGNSAAQAQKSAKPKIIPGADPGGVAVAIIGSGVNYTLPQIASRLARDGEGDIIGLDFIDRDNRPFDVAGPDATPDGIRSMGTTLASVLLAEAARVRLVPVRIQMGEPRAFGGAAAFVASTPTRIAIVAFASANRADWEPFEQAAKTVAANVLFVIPAGDSGQNLDKLPLYPASLKLPNSIVVTAAPIEGDVVPSADANFGAESVDLEISAAAMPALTFSGEPTKVSGSSYAAGRTAALAAALLGDAGNRLSAEDLKARITALPRRPKNSADPRTRSGRLTLSLPFGGRPIAP